MWSIIIIIISFISPAACYDSFNHCVWTVTDDWIDIWSCTGQVRPSTHTLSLRMGLSSLDGVLPSSTMGKGGGAEKNKSISLQVRIIL